MHRGDQHKGKVPEDALERKSYEDRITTLESDLKKAIANEQYEEAAQFRDEILEFSGNESFKAWGAWLEGELGGFAEVFIRPFANGCESRPVPFLEGIWVKQSQRGSGIARKLIATVESWASQNGFSEMGSDVDLSNTDSQRAHENWGFEETERVVYYRKNLR